MSNTEEPHDVEEIETPDEETSEGFRVEFDPEDLDASLAALRQRLAALWESVEGGAQSALHTKVRLRFRGERLGPDLPLLLFLAAEGVAFVAFGPLRAVLGNLAGRAVLDVELVHLSDELVSEGKEAYQHGEIELAEAKYRAALGKRPQDAAALYHLGVLLRVTGRVPEAKRCFAQAAEGPAEVPEVLRAAEALERLSGTGRSL